MIKNSQPFGKKFQKTVGGIFFDSQCIYYEVHRTYYTSACVVRHLQTAT